MSFPYLEVHQKSVIQSQLVQTNKPMIGQEVLLTSGDTLKMFMNAAFHHQNIYVDMQQSIQDVDILLVYEIT